MIQNLNRFLLQKYQDHNYEKLINLKKSEVLKIKTFWEFDTRYTAPIHGFRSAQHYYKESSAMHYLQAITTPTLLIMAQDDPVTHVDTIPSNLSPHIHAILHSKGGHVGFVEGSLLKPNYWLEKRVLQYIVEGY